MNEDLNMPENPICHGVSIQPPLSKVQSVFPARRCPGLQLKIDDEHVKEAIM